MAGSPARNRLPDVPVELIGGGSANLAHFCGQKLVVLFCPADREAAGREIAAYEKLAPAFENAGTWVVGLVAGRAPGLNGHPGSAHIHLGVDAGGRAFHELATHFPNSDEAKPAAGAAFLINRDGNVGYAWLGVGHATKALERARERP
jgi:peroxiredoxin